MRVVVDGGDCVVLLFGGLPGCWFCGCYLDWCLFLGVFVWLVVFLWVVSFVRLLLLIVVYDAPDYLDILWLCWVLLDVSCI